MKSQEIKSGMTVRISGTLFKTRATKGLFSAMREMKGHIYKVKKKYYTDIFLQNSSGELYAFHPADLTEVKMLEPHPPVTFDPENIITS